MNKADSIFLQTFTEEGLPVPLRLADREGRFRSFNPAWLKFTGRSLEQENVDGWLTAIHPEDRPAVSDELAKGVRGARPFQFHYRLRRHDGVYRWMLDSLTPTFEGALLTGWVSTACDVTGLIDARKSASAADNDRTKSAMLARSCEQIFSAVAHDLRNPLNGVQSWTHVLESTLPHASPIVERAIQGIKTSIKRQVRLIDDLLNAMAVVSGQVDLRNERVALNQCVNAGIAKAQELLNEKKLQVELDLSAAEVFVTADVVRMEQIVAGLLMNAVKFSPNGSAITIRTSQADGQGRLDIVDRGPNIPADTAESSNFLNPFHRPSGNDGARAGGWGVAMANELIERHGGQLTVSNGQDAVGIQFSVLFPAIV